ncbi:MAG: glycerol-3-phosphate 1-O-acyltransferase PlsY [Burkholderiaceae bacterium]|nr:glycerol-3-phosphate 1-O-acyltransferase PlsY [Burkholderiales bacterium]MCZ8103199.1 glycerol-3-phosphate 1-O-acyltransferase PlsY [Burkholderiales bacterium]MCZ8339117.1 glycerol-3-phosphate 1-O-acyltransferase PlsY [Burkholderiaceae bacterium]
MPAIVAIVLAYLLGSVSFAVVVSRAMGLADPRSYGSGNPGATNVLRTGNRTAAILTLVGDAAKGAVAVLIAKAVAARYGFGDLTLACVGLAAFVGHLFPVFHGFQGGKGVATAAGVLLALSPWLGLATLATWITIAVFFRYSSLAALAAAVFAPTYYALLAGVDAVLVPLGIMSVLLILRHRKNISNLIAGTETRIGQKKTAA